MNFESMKDLYTQLAPMMGPKYIHSHKEIQGMKEVLYKELSHVMGPKR